MGILVEVGDARQGPHSVQKGDERRACLHCADDSFILTLMRYSIQYDAATPTTTTTCGPRDAFSDGSTDVAREDAHLEETGDATSNVLGNGLRDVRRADGAHQADLMEMKPPSAAAGREEGPGETSSLQLLR